MDIFCVNQKRFEQRLIDPGAVALPGMRLLPGAIDTLEFWKHDYGQQAGKVNPDFYRAALRAVLAIDDEQAHAELAWSSIQQDSQDFVLADPVWLAIHSGGRSRLALSHASFKEEFRRFIHALPADGAVKPWEEAFRQKLGLCVERTRHAA